MAQQKNKAGKTKEQLKQEREELKQLIIQHTDAATGKKYTDEQIDREELKVELQGGKTFLISEVERLMKARAQEVDPIFILEFYEQIYRLRGWDVEKARDFNKPPEVADYTNELIYGRFKPEILQALRILNPYIPGMYARRAYWHYKFFNEEGLALAKTYIKNAIDLMKECSSWYEFRKRMLEEYDVPYQADMFDKNGNVK